MASGHGQTNGCSDQCCRREESPCQSGAVHTGGAAITHPGPICGRPPWHKSFVRFDRIACVRCAACWAAPCFHGGQPRTSRHRSTFRLGGGSCILRYAINADIVAALRDQIQLELLANDAGAKAAGYLRRREHRASRHSRRVAAQRGQRRNPVRCYQFLNQFVLQLL